MRAGDGEFREFGRIVVEQIGLDLTPKESSARFFFSGMTGSGLDIGEAKVFATALDDASCLLKHIAAESPMFNPEYFQQTAKDRDLIRCYLKCLNQTDRTLPDSTADAASFVRLVNELHGAEATDYDVLFRAAAATGQLETPTADGDVLWSRRDV